MSAINKVGIVSFQPPKWVIFNLFHKFYHCSLNILEYSVVSFIPNYPHTQKPKKLHKRTSPSIYSNRVSKLKEMIMKIKQTDSWNAYPIPYVLPYRTKNSQWRNKWVADSSNPHPATHLMVVGWRMSRLKRLILVGSLSQRNLQARIKTFKGTCLCQTNSPVTSIKRIYLKNKIY